MKKSQKVVLIVLGAFIANFVILPLLGWFMFWGMFQLDFLFSPKPPKPEITYAEFPFALEYEVDGVYHKYEDVLICEFDGFDYSTGLGSDLVRKWTSYYKSGNEQIVLYKDNEIEIFFFPIIQRNGNAYFKGAQLMGDGEPNQKPLSTFPDALYKDPDDDNYRNGELISAEDLLSKYKIRLISWQCAPPIKNTFK